MSIPRPILDDRSYQQLRDELVRRIPVYTQEWTDHNPSDPGITLIELFAYLGEILLYRFNQIPEATRLQFLDLLQIPTHAAESARALITVTTDDPSGVIIEQNSKAVAGDMPFETQTELRALPVSVVAISKQQTGGLSDGDEKELTDAIASVKQALSEAGVDVITEQEKADVYYQNVAVSADGSGLAIDFKDAVDKTLWVAVLAEGKVSPATLTATDHPMLLNLGFVPDLEAPAAASIDPCPGSGNASETAAVEWQISTGRFVDGNLTQPEYRRLRVLGDTTDGLTSEGVVRVELPGSDNDIGLFDLRESQELAGTGELPPQLDEETEEKLLFWLRAFRHDGADFGKVQFLGANCTDVVQWSRSGLEFVGTGDGQPDQRFSLVNSPVIGESLELQVEAAQNEWQTWTEVAGFHASTESSRHYVLDHATAQIRFGNGIQGAVPQIGQRIRATGYRSGGGGVAGNVAAGSISKLPEVQNVTVTNLRAAHGGADAETTETALDRIPGELRRRDRAVTESDFRELALMTPGADLGRAECLPRFYPPTGQTEKAGIVTVVVWPARDAAHPNAPVPDRNQLALACRWLDERRLVTTELFVIPPTYRKVAVSVGVVVKDGFGVDAVRLWVELVIRQYLSPLPPYGPSGQGWPLGRRVYGPELEAAALQVEGVEYLEGLHVAGWNGEAWVVGPVQLAVNEVPELDRISVVEGEPLHVDQMPEPDIKADEVIPIPVYRDEC